ncbi:MAG: hypothetical protein ABDH29_07140 [Aquificaceae bacterium]
MEFVESHGLGCAYGTWTRGWEDYTVGLRYGLEPFAPLDEEGRFTEEAPKFIRGRRVF